MIDRRAPRAALLRQRRKLLHDLDRACTSPLAAVRDQRPRILAELARTAALLDGMGRGKR